MAEAAKRETDDVLIRPEVQQAIREAAAKAAADAVAALAQQGIPGATPGAPGAPLVDEASRSLFAQLALSIAEMANQGQSGRPRPVSPAEMQKRQKAHERCERLIEQARERGDKPEYRVIAKIDFNERLIEPFRKEGGRDGKVVAQDIIWTGMPNEALRPLNEVAQKIFDAYREWIGGPPSKLRAVSGPNGGQAVQDGRGFSMTPGGLVVKGEISPRHTIAVDHEFADDVETLDNNDPRAPEVAILGTVAPKARKNFADPAKTQAARNR